MVAKKAAKKSVKKKARKSTAKKAAVSKSTSKKKTVVKHDKAQALIDESTKKEEKSNGWRMHLPLILLILGVLLLVAGVVYLLLNAQPEVDPSQVAASVNGEPILHEQLDTQYALLPEQYRESFTRADVLEQLINEELLIQYGTSQGISVDEAAINEEIQRVLASGGLTITELQQNLMEFDLTIEHFEELVERKLIIEESMSLITQRATIPSNEDARALYDANQGEFIEPRQVSVQHILIASQRENAAVLARDLRERVDLGEDFCGLVEEYSDDQGSVNNCGEYTFPRGFMVPEFEEAAFSMQEQETTVVQTTFGYHIIRKLDDIPARTQEFEEVREDILRELTTQARTKAYQEFIAQAREDATIVYQ